MGHARCVLNKRTSAGELRNMLWVLVFPVLAGNNAFILSALVSSCTRAQICASLRRKCRDTGCSCHLGFCPSSPGPEGNAGWEGRGLSRSLLAGKITTNQRLYDYLKSCRQINQKTWKHSTTRCHCKLGHCGLFSVQLETYRQPRTFTRLSMSVI